MRSLFAGVSALLLLQSGGAHAQETAPPSSQDLPDASAPKTHAERLEGLFAQLKRERNEKRAERIAARIWQEWNRSGSAVTDLMMRWSQEAIQQKKFDVALDFLDQVITLAPSYAEGWNRRATVHYMMHNYRKSMADIEKTLELEPRHFGALSGLAQIMKERGRKQLALDAYERVLAVFPMMRSAQEAVGKLSEELTGDAI